MFKFEIIAIYKKRKKNKIAIYNQILAMGRVVICVEKDISGNFYFGKVWENQYGGGSSITHVLPSDYIGYIGRFIVSNETYDFLVSICEKTSFSK